MRRFIGILVVISVILSIILYHQLRRQRLEAEGPSGGSATIEGIEVEVVSRMATRILEIRAEEGDLVTAGQVVAVLDCREQEAMLQEAEAAIQAATAATEGARAQVALAQLGIQGAQRQTEAAEAAVRATQAQSAALESQRDAARRAAERLAHLQGSGGASEQDLDTAETLAGVLSEQIQALRVGVRASQAQATAVSIGEETTATQLLMAEAQAEAAAADLQRARAARTRLLTLMEECQLHAPRSGYVQTRSFEPGELVAPGSRLMTIVDTHQVRATFYLPNAELGAARPGLAVELVADAYPDRVFFGTIRQVAASAEFTPRNVQTRQDRDRLVYAVEVEVDNPDDALRPGMPVQVVIPDSGRGGREQESEGSGETSRNGRSMDSDRG